jgi:murein DD-endopeptidase MepM/ murein hydrolase activator NlpD
MRKTWLVLVAALAASEAQAAPTVQVVPDEVRPGGAVLVRVRGISSREGARAPAGRLGEQALRFFRVDDGWAALGVAPLDDTGEVVAHVDVPDGSAETIDEGVQVVAHTYPTAQLKVDPIYVDPPAEAEGRIVDDEKAIAAAFAKDDGPALWTRDFLWPVRRNITSRFGEHRVFNGTKESRHLGTDLAGRLGAAIGAANDGEVVLARDCFFTGNTVIVRHGAGLYTAYFHLSDVLVKEGQRVKQSELVGRIGETGRTTGPHLHYGVRVANEWADPESFMALSIPAPLPDSEPRG